VGIASSASAVTFTFQNNATATNSGGNQSAGLTAGVFTVTMPVVHTQWASGRAWSVVHVTVGGKPDTG